MVVSIPKLKYINISKTIRDFFFLRGRFSRGKKACKEKTVLFCIKYRVVLTTFINKFKLLFHSRFN